MKEINALSPNDFYFSKTVTRVDLYFKIAFFFCHTSAFTKITCTLLM